MSLRKTKIKTAAQKVMTMSEFLTRRQLADLFQISMPTVLRWEKSGRLHPTKLGSGTVRHRRSDVEAFIAGAVKR
jgi:excisionase family DNA binding protein